MPSFDGLRGGFILLVVGYHVTILGFLAGMPVVIDWFFVASGFLITTLLLDEQSRTNSVSLKQFYSRRILRLFPAMYAMLAFFLVMALVARFIDPSFTKGYPLWWAEIVGAALYSYNIVAAVLPGQLPGLIGHTWSLSVEEQFYMIWPLIMTYVLRRGRRSTDRALLIGCVVFVATMVTLRFSLQHMINFTPDKVSYADDGNATWQGILYRLAAVRPDSIVLGCLAAFLARAIPRPVPQYVIRWLRVLGPLGWVFFIGTVALAGRARGFELFGGVVYQITLFMLVPITLDLYFRPHSPYTRLFSIKPLRWLGVRSYGIYLWHVPVLLPFLPLINSSYGMRRLVVGLLVGAAGVLAGAASFRFIESPFLRLKERRFRKPAQQAEYEAIELERETLSTPEPPGPAAAGPGEPDLRKPDLRKPDELERSS